MNMNLCYPAKVKKARDGYTVTFRDIPGAISGGDSLSQALDESRDALALILEDMLEEGEPIPQPSQARSGEKWVAVPPDVAGRVLLRVIRQETSLSKSAAAGRVGLTRQSYGQMEARGRNLTLKTLADVSGALGYEIVLSLRARSATDKPVKRKAPARQRSSRH